MEFSFQMTQGDINMTIIELEKRMKENTEDFLNKLLSFFPNKAVEYNAFLL